MFYLFFTLILATSNIGFAAGLDSSSKKTREMAAILIQDRSIQKLEEFIKHHPNDRREIEFQKRLADLYLEKSGISFQYTEGESVRTKQKLYQSSLQKAVQKLDLLISKYPSHPGIDESLFKRGKAHQELGRMDLAKKNYLEIIAEYPQFIRLDSVLLELANFSQEVNQHEEALKYLNKIEKMVDSPYWNVALRKSAWSHFNLAQYHQALKQIEKELERSKNDIESLEVESAYQDTALFLFESVNHRSESNDIRSATKWISRICEIRDSKHKKHCLGLTYLKFAKLLKAYQYRAELEFIQDHLIDQHLQLPETFEITLLLHQFYQERHEYGKMAKIIEEARQIAKEQKKEQLQSLIQTIEKTLMDLHGLVAKNLKSTDLNRLLDPLDGLTRILVEISDGQNPAKLDFEFAMAETAFSAKKFELSAQWYESMIHEINLPSSKWNKKSIQLRQIAALYESLKLIKPEKSKIEKWISLFNHISDDHSVEAESFHLQALKMEIQYLDSNQGLGKLLKFSENTRHQTLQQEAATLAFESLRKSQDQKGLLLACQLKSWSLVPTISIPCKMMLARDALTNGKVDLAEKTLEFIQTKDLNEESKKAAWLLKSEIHRKQGKVDIAVEEQEAYLQLTAWKESTLAQSSFLHHWMNRNTAKMNRYLNDSKLRASLGESFLEPFQASVILEQSESETKQTEALYHHRFKSGVRSHAYSTALWALSPLKQPSKIPFQDRLLLLQRIATHWDHLDAHFQLRFLPIMKKRVALTIMSIQKDARSIAPLKDTIESAERRVSLLHDVDLTFSKIMKLDFVEVKLNTLKCLQMVYQDFVSDLQKVQTPPELIQPFLIKQQEFKKAEIQIAAIKPEAT